MRRPLTPTQRLFIPTSFLRTVAGLAVGAGGPFLAVEVGMLAPLGTFPTLPFLVVIVLATLIGRLSGGLLATGVSVILLDYWFIHPTVALSLLTVEDLLALLGFAAVATTFAAVLARQDRATARAQAEGRRLEFLTRVGDVLSRTLDVDERIEELSRTLVPEAADWCVIHLVDDAPANGRGGLRVGAVSHHDPRKTPLARRLQDRYGPDPASPIGVPNVLRTGRSEVYPRITRRRLKHAARDEEHLRLAMKVGYSSAVIAPVVSHDKVIGTITLVSAESKRRYGPPDQSLAEEIGARAGLAIENARLYEERDHIAETLQRALLPPALPDIPKFELSAFYRPSLRGSRVGGDFYDVFPVEGDAWMLVIGDACGKGPEAAAVTGLVRYTIRAIAARETSPAKILSELNETLYRTLEGDDFATVAVVHVARAPGGARLTASCGGHPPPVAVREDGMIERLGEPGVLVGAFASGTYRDFVSRVRRGELVLLYTDGLTSKDEGDAFAEGSRLREAVAALEDHSPESVLGLIREHVTSHGAGDPQDDVAVLALRPVPAGARRQLASVMTDSDRGRH